jgi:hypothetical protein
MGDDLPEIRVEAYDKIDQWRDELDRTAKLKKRDVYERAAHDLLLEAQSETDLRAIQAITDAVYALGSYHAGLDDEDIQFVMVGAKAKAERPINDRATLDGAWGADGEPPPPNGPADYYSNGKTDELSDADQPPLTIEEWLARDLPAPDFIMGSWLSTTTRGLLVGPTGLGKTNLALALALHIAVGRDFLHWRGQRSCKVLYIDGEMSRRLFKQRIEDAVNRLGERPAGFHALSHEDVEKFAPLNTRAGRAYIERLITEIEPDFIVFDAIMCLLAGEMKEGQSWAAVMPWVRSLTRRRIGQLWLHHTGHDESRSYGDKAKEWQLDTVMHMEAVAREDADVSFAFEFRKARERTPATRADFQRARIAIVGDQWTVDVSASVRRGHVSPLGEKFLDALHNALFGDTVQHYGRRAVTLELWKAECFKIGILDRDKPPKPTSALWSKYRLELIAANRIACDNTMAWIV